MAKSPGFAPASPTEKAKQRRENPRPLQERATVEGNLMEYPIFALSPRDAKPSKPDPLGRKDPETGELLWVPDLEKYERTLGFEQKTESGTVYRTLKIRAAPPWGFPSMLAMEVLVYLCHRTQLEGFSSPYAPFTFYDFATRTNRSTSGKSISNIRNAINSLIETTITFTDAWSRHPSAEDVQAAVRARESGKQVDIPKPIFVAETIVRMCQSARLIKKPGSNTPPDILGALKPPVDIPGVPAGYIRLSDEVFWSLKNGYRFGIDPDYLFDLRSPIAKRLYILLTKRDDRKPKWEQDLINFARRVGISRIKSPADALDQMKDAIEELRTPKADGKVFLKGAEITDTRSGREKVSFFFAKATPAAADELAGRLHETLKERLRADIYERWFQPLRFSLSDADDVQPVIIVTAPDAFHRDFVQDNYLDWLSELAQTAVGRAAKVHLVS